LAAWGNWAESRSTGIGKLAIDLIDLGQGKDGPHECSYGWLGLLGHLAEQVAHEVGPAPLPGASGQDRGDSGLEPAMGIEMTNLTPDSPRSTRLLKKAVQPAPSSEVITSQQGWSADRLGHCRGDDHGDVDNASCLPALYHQASSQR